MTKTDDFWFFFFFFSNSLLQLLLLFIFLDFSSKFVWHTIFEGVPNIA